MLSRIAFVSAVAVTASAFGQDVPSLNPAFNADGTKTYWTGNNMQWTTQEALDHCAPGDIIVIRGGSYVGSLYVNKPNLTIRPFVDSGTSNWEEVELWNPTQGPQDDNGWAIALGPDTENTYIGRPRQFRQLPNGYISETMIVPGEYAGTGAAVEVDDIGGRCFTFWSRSINNTGVYSNSGKGTFELCDFTSQSGFGGGAMLVGDANDTSFVDCTFKNLYANGSTLNTTTEGLELPNYVISILSEDGGTMEPSFSRCFIEDNEGESIVYQVGGGGTWHDVDFKKNRSLVNYSGVVTLLGANPHFSECLFEDNESGFGTIFMDGNGVSDLDPVKFHNCRFKKNNTIDGEFGGVFYAQDSTVGMPPKIMLDNCKSDNNNNPAGGPPNTDINPDDFVSPYFPTYRQGGSNENALTGSEDGGVDCTPSADLNGDGIVNGQDLGLIFGLWGTDGSL